MASKTKRKNARAKRRRRRPTESGTIDPHVSVVLASVEAMFDTVKDLDPSGSADPGAAAATALVVAADEVASHVAGIEPATLIEVARLGALPWSREGTVGVDPDAAVARAELLGLIALAARKAPLVPTADEADTIEGVQPITDLVHGTLFGKIDALLRLAQARDLFEVDMTDPLAHVSTMMRGAEIWVRNNSYPDMVEQTVRDLFRLSAIRKTLKADLGFDADEAISVLQACHEVQVELMNDRMKTMYETMQVAMESVGPDGAPDQDAVTVARAAWTQAWEGNPDVVAATVPLVATKSGHDEGVAEAVLKYFSVDIESSTPSELVENFTRGDNPLRTHPVVAVGDDFMLVHNAHVFGAVRENLEQHLKSTATWETYQKFRGELLETRTTAALLRILPGARFRDGVNYYVPANAGEETQSPATYTKRVEGDHLVTIDDVAFIVEDKAVAVSPDSRSGKSRRLRRDLAGIVTKAAEQSGRLRDRIVEDHGVRIDGEGWVDFSHIREIHTIAVSLDELTSVSTATAELVRAGVLNIDNIPWTVSIHDLDLITMLVDHPAEFLLYLRRRRNALTTVMYSTADELDLFLYFFSQGLWVEPDPDAVRTAFPFLGEVKPGERRRYKQQKAGLITSHTDALDQWYYARKAIDAGGDNGPGGAPLPPKPAFAGSPLRALIDELKARGDYAWLSISATLLSGSTAAQAKFARIPHDLLSNPFGDGRERSHTVPWVAPTVEEGWLLAWFTRPAGRDTQAFEKKARDYLRVKMHQVGMPRGVLFVFSEQTNELVDVYFDDYLGDLDPELAKLSRFLKPPTAFSGQVNPAGKVRAGTRKKSVQRKKGGKRR